MTSSTLMRRIFTDIYRQNVWGSPESVSGPGSTRERAADFVQDLIGLLRNVGTKTLLDAPCGDFNWMDEVARTVEHYIGVDVVPELIEHSRRRFDASGRTFLCLDLTVDPLPRADVILCRDGLVHFSLEDIGRALQNFKKSGSTYLLSTTFVEVKTNTDIRTGEWRTINLQQAPFFFPPPMAVIDEKCLHTGGIYADKRLALWSIHSLNPAER